MKKTMNYAYLLTAIAMLIYAAPHLHVGQGLTLPTVFAIVWLGFALIIIGAHLYGVLHTGSATKKAIMPKSDKQMSRQKQH